MNPTNNLSEPKTFSMPHFYCYLKRLLFVVLLFFTTAVFSQPIVSSFSPVSGPVGTTVTITGSGFSTQTDSNIVYFGAVRAAVSAASPTSLTVTVPMGATYRPITVTTNRLTGYSRQSFAVTFANGGYVFHQGSFSLPNNYGTGSNPRSAAVVDLNGDGKPDVFVTNQVGAQPSIFRNRSTPGSLLFAYSSNVTLGSGPFGVAAGDLNGDGKPDLAVTNSNSGQAGTLTVLRNVSVGDTIAFVTRTDSVGWGPVGVAIADMDMDGKPDVLVAAGNSGTISLYRNITTSVNDIQFAAKVDISNFNHGDAIAVADFDGDGKPDIASANFSGGNISIYQNFSTPGTLGFASGVNYNAGSSPNDIATGDFNGDGKPDIAVINYSSATVSVFKNTSTTGAIAFDTKIDLATGTNPASISIGDLNGDGKPEIIVPSNVPPATAVFRNTSDSTGIAFAGPVNYALGQSPTGSAIVDLDNDGKPDFLTLNNFSVMTMYLNKGRQPYINSFSPTTADSGKVVTIRGIDFTGATSVTFGTKPAQSFTVLSDTVITAVVGGGASGFVNVTTPNGTASKPGFVYRAAPVITAFAPTSGNRGALITIVGRNFATATAVAFGGVLAGSFTKLSDTVIQATVGAGATGAVGVANNFGVDTLGGFTFKQTPVITSVTPSSGPIGSQATIVGNNLGDSASSTVYFGAVKATVLSATPTSLIVSVPAGASYQPITVTTGGYTAYSAQPFIVTFPGAASTFTASSFAPKTNVTVASSQTKILEGDLDGDGKPDLIGYGASQLTLLRNTTTNGVVSFAAPVYYSTGTIVQGIAIGDIDGDGKLDIAVTNSNENVVSVFRNMSIPGTISLGGRLSYATYTSPYDVAIGDLDGDGKPELAVINGNPRTVSVLKNVSTPGTVAFTSRVDFAVGGVLSRDIIISDLNNDNRPDIAITIWGTSADSVCILRNTAPVPGTLAFASYINLPSSRGAWGISAGDVDKDGKTDVIVTNRTANTVSVYRNTSDSSGIAFANRVEYATDASPIYAAIGDADGDNKPEIVYNSPSTAGIGVLKNNSTAGTVSFAPKVNYADSVTRLDVLVGDLNGDGKPELVTSGGSQAVITIVRNQVVPASIALFTPDSARTGDTVRIYGTHFTGTTAVSFGDTAAASFTVVDDSRIIAIVGQGASGRVAVTTPTGTVFKTGFTYLGAQPQGPSISSFNPTHGSRGTVVNIVGLHFTGTSAVSFGGTPADSVVVLSDSLIQAVVGAGSTGPVVVQTPLGIASDTGFVYTDSITPIITSFSPYGGATGAVIYIFGSRFTGATEVRFGGTLADSMTVLSDTVIVAIVGNGSSGNVSVTTPNGTASKAGFTYESVPHPVITYFTPQAAAKGTIVSIYGTHFTGATAVRFGGTLADSITVLSDSLVLATVGNGSSGYVSITTPGGIASDTGFTFIPPAQPVITAVLPASGAVGSSVLITGHHFNTTTTGNTVYFGAVRATVTAASDSALSVVVPGGATYQPVTVTANNLTAYSKQPFNVTFAGTGFSAGSFAAKTDFTTGAYPRHVSIADLNGDGKSDLVVVNNNGNSISVYRNTSSTGSVSLAAKSDYFGGTNPFNATVADVDGDGRKDVIVASYGSDSVVVYKNTSVADSITFGSPAWYRTGTNPIMVAVRDVDNDGKADIVTVNNNGNSVSVLKNTSSAYGISFNYKVDFGVGNWPVAVTVADLDGDGLPEIITANNNSNTISVLKNKSTASTLSFTTRTDYATGTSPYQVSCGDLNGDGKPELIVANIGSSTISVFRNTSDTALVYIRTDYAATSGPIYTSLDNLDGDGKPDISIADFYASVVSVIKNNSSSGSVALGTKIDFTSGMSPRAVAAGDLDGDGKPDLAVVNSNSNTLSIFRNLIQDSAFITSRLQTTGNSELQQNRFVLYPNPAYQYTIMEHPASNHAAQIQVVDVTGRLVKTVLVANNSRQTRLNVQGLMTGTYTLVWSNGASTITRSLLVK
jgi:hypothetical protein